MNAVNIQEQLNEIFSKSDNRFVFWFDDKKEFEDEVSNFNLKGINIYVLDNYNWFYTKYLLNEVDKEGKYLIYAPFAKPSDDKNPLADMCHYSVQFYTDRVSQVIQELGINPRFKEHLDTFRNFWKNKKRIDKFKALEIDNFNVENINIGLLAVLTDVDTPNFEEIVKTLMLSDYKKYFKLYESCGLTDAFWELCRIYFAYDNAKPSFEDLMASLIITYTADSLKGSLIGTFRSFILKKKNDVVVFIRNIMDNVNYQDEYNKLAQNIDKKLRFVDAIKEALNKGAKSVNMSDTIKCDAFRDIDLIVLDWIIDNLNDELLDSKIDGMSIEEIAKNRISTAFHYGDMFKNEYNTLIYAYSLMKACCDIEYASDCNKMIDLYTNELYKIDSYYRWFCFSFDKIEDNERFLNIRERVEKIYNNEFLSKLTPKWTSLYNEESHIEILPQERFYNYYIKDLVEKQRIIVIISDAFRYECARELFDKLELDEKCSPKIESMLGVLPSITSLGMASLLPHDEIDVDINLNVNVIVKDNKKACNDTISRDKILKSYNQDNIALKFSDLINADKTKLREYIQGKKAVYIYHNQIDARGDEASTEDEVFNACSEAIEEIYRLIKRLNSFVSASRFFVTADHGFLYKRDKLQEYDKVSYNKNACTVANKRYLISKSDITDIGMMSRKVPYIKDGVVTTLSGADIFKVAGSGQNYVHGGTSMQEIIVPVIDVNVKTRGVETEYVDVVLTSPSRKITNRTTYFEFIQKQKVTDIMKGRNLVAYFVTKDGEKISYEVPITANIKDDVPSKRTFREKITLKSREYSIKDTFYLVLADVNNEKNILHKYEYMIDIPFIDEFDL